MHDDIQLEKDKEMNLVGHLSELRNRLIITAISFVIFFVLGFIYVKEIYHFLQKDLDFKLAIIGPTEIIWVYITIAGIVAVIGTLPVFSIQLWLFVKPGLTSKERKASLAYIPAVFILFVIGLTFGYLIYNYFILPFLISLNDGMFTQLFTVEKYFSFMLRIILIFGLLFEIPIITMFLTSLGILSPQFLRKMRKYAYFILLIIGALVTPPDIFLQLLVAFPLFALYEISIYFSLIVERRKKRKHESFMNKD